MPDLRKASPRLVSTLPLGGGEGGGGGKRGEGGSPEALLIRACQQASSCEKQERPARNLALLLVPDIHKASPRLISNLSFSGGGGNFLERY